MKRFIMMVATLTLVSGMVFILTACSSSEVGSKHTGSSVNLSDEGKLSDLSGNEDSEEYEEGFYRDNDEKLDFNKSIHYVHVGEINTDALHEKPSGGISSQDTHYYKEDNLLYFFYDAILPTEETEMVVVEDQFNHDYMLDYKLHQSDNDKIKLDFGTIDNEHVNNDNRLFLESKVNVSKVSGSEVVIVTVDGEIHEVEKDESKEIVLERGEIKSSIEITNYGLFNSIEDMTYQNVIGLERPSVEDEVEYEKVEEDDSLEYEVKIEGDNEDEDN